MKNNKGFLSISVVYSFFIVFLALLLFIVSSYVNNRTLLSKVKDDIKGEAETILSNNFRDYIISTVNSDSTLNYHNSSLSNGAKDNSYRYSGLNPNNYVCFAYDQNNTSVCNDPTNNSDYLYRIIGIFEVRTYNEETGSYTTKSLVKLVKNTNYTTDTYEWNAIANYNNTWSTSDINTRALNTIYLTNLGSWDNYIAIPTWIVGGSTNSYIINQNANTVFTREITSPAYNYQAETKIGLMYVSDYLYATNRSYWTSTNYTTIKNNNFLGASINEWLITRNSSGTTNAYYKTSDGSIVSSDVTSKYSIRPTFYLKDNVLVSGKHEGTANDPYRISLPSTSGV